MTQLHVAAGLDMRWNWRGPCWGVDSSVRRQSNPELPPVNPKIITRSPNPMQARSPAPRSSADLRRTSYGKAVVPRGDQRGRSSAARVKRRRASGRAQPPTWPSRRLGDYGGGDRGRGSLPTDVRYPPCTDVVELLAPQIGDESDRVSAAARGSQGPSVSATPSRGNRVSELAQIRAEPAQAPCRPSRHLESGVPLTARDRPGTA